MNKNYPTGTVPVNKNYPTGTVSVNKNYPTGTVPVNKNYPTGTLNQQVTLLAQKLALYSAQAEVIPSISPPTYQKLSTLKVFQR